MNFLKKLLARGCAHRFSWPRIDDDGRHYQVCLICGTAYEYDWKMMRRTRRLPAHPNVENRLILPPHLTSRQNSNRQSARSDY